MSEGITKEGNTREGIKRRDFLKVIGVSGAGAGMLGCSTDEVERLLPYVIAPEEITPGVSTWYASVCGECSAGCGTWVRTREGRVIKVEGNPNHPISQGALCAHGHSSLQALYNPDRFAGPMVRDGEGFRQISWDEAESLLVERVQAAAGQLLLVSEKLGPSMAELADAFLASNNGRRVEYDGLSEAPLREAVRIVFGTDAIPTYNLEETRFLVSFGADFVETWLSPVEYSRGFARASGVDEHGSKGHFVFVGPRLSLTGQNADEWLPIQPGSEAVVALAMANVVSNGGQNAGPYSAVVAAYTPENAATASGMSADAIRELAERFVSEGPSLALGPGVSGHHRGATAANVAVLILNAVAGNVGRTIHVQSSDRAASSAPYGDLQGAITAMSGGQVGVAMVHGSNPAYSLPAASGFAEAFANVQFKVSFASAMDETTALADLILPDQHSLESWGDSNPRNGLYAVRQPAMRPVPHFDSKSTGDVLLGLAGRLGQDLGAATFRDYVKNRWSEMHSFMGAEQATGQDADTFWREALRTGVAEFSVESPSAPASLRSPDVALSYEPPALDAAGDLTLMVYPSSRFGDGKFANRPWLLEMPDPVSKITWHSWVEVNPHTAGELGLRDGDVVTVRSSHGAVDVPVWTYPGIREDVVAIAMGGGHENYGRFADGQGVNPLALLPAEVEQPSGALVYQATTVSLEATGARRQLASTEGSHDQSDREIVRAVTLASLTGGQETGEGEGEHHEPLRELQGVGGFIPVETEGRPEDFPLEGARHGEYADPENTPRWAMAIDLDKCTGCSACITACQAENNVPWVGEEQMLMGRDMHWMRIERYYEHVDATQADHLDVRILPMLCQHCGNAPCEPVCPVFAAYHTPDGLNAQIYNRCVGTRYCANNCPYKVRVFNWYSYTDHIPEPMNWQFNPDVTVRENGVMEKCSFCVHRIRDAEHRASLESRGLAEGEVVTACQQSCPAEAIVFGNIRDPQSRVAQVTESERTYRVLDELINTQPAVSYLKKVTFHEIEEGGH